MYIHSLDIAFEPCTAVYIHLLRLFNMSDTLIEKPQRTLKHSRKACGRNDKMFIFAHFTQYIYTAFSLLIKILRKAFALLCTVIMKPDFSCLVKKSTV